MKRVFALILGILCVLLVFWLGLKTLEGKTIITVLFGISCALIAPIGLTALGYSFRKKDSVFARLSKVPQIEELIQEVATQEDNLRKIALLKKELKDYIRNEAYLLAATERKKLLVEEAQRIIKEMEDIELKTSIILDQLQDDDEEVKAIKTKIRNIISLQRRLVISMPFFGGLMQVEYNSKLYNTIYDAVTSTIKKIFYLKKTHQPTQRADEKD